jgi:hypothetical protein
MTTIAMNPANATPYLHKVSYTASNIGMGITHVAFRLFGMAFHANMIQERDPVSNGRVWHLIATLKGEHFTRTYTCVPKSEAIRQFISALANAAAE